MDNRLRSTPEVYSKNHSEVEDSQKKKANRFHRQEYTKEMTPLEDRYKDGYIQQFKQISEELTKLEQTIPTDLPQLELDEGIQKHIDEYENKQKEQKLFPALQIEGQPPISWKIWACENRIPYGEKMINSLAKYITSSKDLAGHSEELLNLYRFSQKKHYRRVKKDYKDLKKICIYLLKEHNEDLKYNHEDIPGNDEYLEQQHIDLKKRYSQVKDLKKYYNSLEDLNKAYKENHDKHEGPHNDLEQFAHDKNILKCREHIRDLEKFYQHQYQDPYENLDDHLKDLKERLKNIEARCSSYLEKNLQDLEKLSSYLIEHCEGLGEENRKYLKKALKKLKKQWEELEKPDQNLEERCKNLEERWKDFVASSKAYLPDIKLLHKKMETQEANLSKILDVYNDKRKDLMKLKYNLEDKLKELHTFRERSQKSETSSDEDDSHPVSTRFENAHRDNLTRHIDELEKFLDDKREIIHRDLKKLSFHLKGNLIYFLDKQKHETDFYLKNPNLQHFPEVHLECGIVCTVMVADLLKNWKNIEKLLQNFAEVYPKVVREDTKGTTATYTYPIVLKRIGHYINYEYAKVPDIAKKKYETPKTNAKWDEAYRSHMGKDPKEITVDDFKNVIGQKDKDGNVIPVIASITMDFHTKCYHAIVLDGWDKTPEGEELLVVRDIHTEISPETGKPLTNNQGRLWKDFLEVWTGVAVIPTVESDPN